MVHIWLPVFMYTLPKSYENCYTEWKNHADSKYDSQFALRAIPDYEPLSVQKILIHLQVVYKIFFQNVISLLLNW